MPHKILIADDNEVNTFVLSQFLSRMGLSVEVASDGEEATQKALSDEFDLVLMDLNMPILDGNEAAVKILNQKPHYKIYAITALTEDETIEVIKGTGIQGYIAKPFNPQQLSEVINNILQA